MAMESGAALFTCARAVGIRLENGAARGVEEIVERDQAPAVLAVRQEDGTHRFFGSREPEKI